jgi:hypothetical protein
MCYITTTEACCSLAEIGSFSREETVASIKEAIIEDLLEYKDYRTGDLKEYPTCYIATTTTEQIAAAEALKALGFVGKKFYGRHQPSKGPRNKYMTLWTRTSIPPGILREAKRRAKEYL